MRLVPVDSSAVEAVGYAARQRALTVKFVDGRAYQYLGVPMDVYITLLHTDSVGRAYNDLVVKAGYPCRRVDTQKVDPD